ncbi:hypothetical protein IV203_027376 [Nitzschia inconspicua]|uniref:DUF6824 domain-containing protein n=1 Tax=Nitzschia inconspicua TaxID=303405 RepID=A0A9K3LXJ8_9STRA|nr:hypothetical protein IV203_027376 [Nitzschia inconspicua]
MDVPQRIVSFHETCLESTTNNGCEPCVQDETQIGVLLQQFDQALSFYGSNGDDGFLKTPAVLAYRMALHMAPSLALDTSFRIMFLRADDYNPLAAAQRFVKFFQHKMELFGAENLGKEIAIRDLSDEDRNYIYEGWFQLAKEKDHCGRTVFCDMIKNINSGVNERSMLRAIYYLTMCALQDDNVQKGGLVRLVFALQPVTNAPFAFDARAVTAAAKLRSALPARYSATHYCFTQASFLMYVNCEQHCNKQFYFVPPKVCLHQASAMELQFGLQTCGIPASCVPVSMLGTNVKVEAHEEWLEAQKFKELLKNGAAPGEDDIFSAMPNFVLGDLDPTPMKQSVGGPLPASFSKLQRQARSNAFPPQLHDQASLGCDSNVVPVLVGGTISCSLPQAAHLQSLMSRQAQDSAQSKSVQYQPQKPESSPSSPNTNGLSNFDVLFGRGKVKDHYGNIYLHKLIAMNQDRYEAAERWEKTVIAEEIVSIIRDRGGRFLKPSKVNAIQTWEVVDIEAAREKVSHTFRSRRPKSSSLSSTATAKRTKQNTTILPENFG